MNKIFFVDNYLFDGIVTHKRLHPIIHSFKYYATYFWFDIKNFKESFLFKKNRFSFFSFYENDHGTKQKKKCLYESILNNLKGFGNEEIEFIKILCLPRIIGYSFNPISIYVCYNQFKEAKIIIFEVNNTFNERHSYYCQKLNDKGIFNFKKELHVSPFFKVEGSYKIKLEISEDKISFYIDYLVRKKKVFTATFIGKALKLNSYNLIKLFFKNMFQNLKITFGIYFQALKLFHKGVKYIKKPNKSQKEFTSIK